MSDRQSGMAAIRAAVQLLVATRKVAGKPKPILLLTPNSDGSYCGLPEEEDKAIHTILNGAQALLDGAERAQAGNQAAWIVRDLAAIQLSDYCGSDVGRVHDDAVEWVQAHPVTGDPGQ